MFVSLLICHLLQGLMVLHCGLAVLLGEGPFFFAVGGLSADAEGVYDLGVLLGSCFLFVRRFFL